MNHPPEFLEIDWDSRTIAVEYRFISADVNDAPLIIFLHEGLGSLSLWKEFPNRLCRAIGYRGMVYSRPGYGRSTPFDRNADWGIDFMHRQAYEVLPTLLQRLNINPGKDKVWLFGHSDGASIALLYGAANPNTIQGIIAVAPHVMVEDITIDSIRHLERIYRTSKLSKKFAAHHASPDATFDGWCRIWLDHNFRKWSIEADLNAIKVPVLTVQGTDDEYGTAKQISTIGQYTKNTQAYWIKNCGHTPHRTHPDELLDCSATFIQKTCTN